MKKGNLTFTMVKPKAMQDGHLSSILKMITDDGFKIIALKLTKLTKQQAEKFYEVHCERPFYGELTEFMSSGPIVAAMLKKEKAVEEYRKFIGNTDPAKAEPGTVRHRFGTSIQENAVHGSDSDENALIESKFFFCDLEIFENY